MPIKTWSETKDAFKTIWEKKAKGPAWIFKRFVNIIDDPIDWVKEHFHGHHLPFGYELNISFMMVNRRPTTWDIIRKRKPGGYPNSDPEDIT